MNKKLARSALLALGALMIVVGTVANYGGFRTTSQAPSWTIWVMGVGGGMIFGALAWVVPGAWPKTPTFLRFGNYNDEDDEQTA
jgi:hypothetical protein